MSGEQEGTTPAPVLRIVRGAPGPEELAALVAVVSAMSGGEAAPEPAPAGQWSAPARLHRQPVSPGGAGSWWASGLPR